MKICVSTVYDTNNCGAFLQAYALKETLEKMGHDVVHLEYITKKEQKRRVLQYDKISKLQYLKRHIGFSYQNYRLYRKASKHFDTISKEEVSKCDCMIIGSDELWNVNNQNVFNYLKKVPYDNDNIYAYAICCGNASYEDLLKYPKLINDIKKIDKIYPRDAYTKKQVERVLEEECVEVCDPTFLLDLDEYESVNYSKLPFNYIMYYGYWSEERVIDNIERYSKQANLEICSIGMKNFRIKNNYLCHPLNFPKYISDAQLVVTSTFHGTIFSILEHKNFVVIDFGHKKTQMLLKKMGLENRLIKPDASYRDYLSVIETEIDYSKVETIISDMRKNGLNILYNMLYK